jgi:hypothetical protein
MEITLLCYGKHTRLPWQMHPVAMKNSPGCHGNSTKLLYQPHQETMKTIPGSGYYNNHSKLLWLPHLDTTPNYQDNHIAPSCHDNNTMLSWLITITPVHVAMTSTLCCHGNHISCYQNNQTMLTWRPCQVATATTLVFLCDHMILQRCHGNFYSLLIPIKE